MYNAIFVRLINKEESSVGISIFTHLALYFAKFTWLRLALSLHIKFHIVVEVFVVFIIFFAFIYFGLIPWFFLGNWKGNCNNNLILKFYISECWPNIRPNLSYCVAVYSNHFGSPLPEAMMAPPNELLPFQLGRIQWETRNVVHVIPTRWQHNRQSPLLNIL